jgi:hypothetical protein
MYNGHYRTYAGWEQSTSLSVSDGLEDTVHGDFPQATKPHQSA